MSGLTTGPTAAALISEEFHGLAGELARWRTNPQLNLLHQKQGTRGRVLAFVKGLRFSARVAYLVRGILDGEAVEVSWGHLIDETGCSCSPECDIVIHKPGCLRCWNNSARPIMEFKFINCTDAIAVISCKSHTRSIDKDYCNALAPYNIDKVFLFAECCSPRSVSRLTSEAAAAGYAGFCYLYSIKTGDDKFVVNEEGILGFIDAMKDLV